MHDCWRRPASVEGLLTTIADTGFVACPHPYHAQGLHGCLLVTTRRMARLPLGPHVPPKSSWVIWSCVARVQRRLSGASHRRVGRVCDGPSARVGERTAEPLRSLATDPIGFLRRPSWVSIEQWYNDSECHTRRWASEARPRRRTGKPPGGSRCLTERESSKPQGSPRAARMSLPNAC